MGPFQGLSREPKCLQLKDLKIQKRRFASASVHDVFPLYSRICLLVLCCCLTLTENNNVQALPWGSAHAGNTVSHPTHPKQQPSFLSRFLRTKAVYPWNGTGGASIDDDYLEDDEIEETDEIDFQDDNSTLRSIRARFLAATRNSSLAHAFAEQIDNMPINIKSFLERDWPSDSEEEEEEDGDSEEFEEESDGMEEATTISTALRAQLKESLASFKEFLHRGLIYPEENTVAEETFVSDLYNNDANNNDTRTGVRARFLASTRNSTIGTAFAEQIRSITSMRDILWQRNSTSSMDWFAIVSTSSHRSSSHHRLLRGGDEMHSNVPANGLDRFGRNICLNLGKVVIFQCLATWVQKRETNWMQKLADKMLSEESALAVKKIRGILANMEDHGVVDVFSKFTSQEIAASLYALYKLQRAAIRYESMQGEGGQGRKPEDLVQVLEDLSHYVLYATAAYGWKMDLAFQRRLHLGDEKALLRKTGIEKEDLIKVSRKSKAHLPVFFLARDRQKKALVLCIRGTWSLSDLLTDLCCTPEEYAGPTGPQPTTYLPSWKTPRRRYCAHNGMLDAAMAVAIEMEDIIEEALAENPDYSLVLVGHSMGAGCCSLLATFWEKKFKNMKTYLYGGPCVSPLESHPTNSTAIINVINEGDPFRCLSLGHVADLSSVVAKLCEDHHLRRGILSRTEGHLHEMDIEDLEFCWNKMQDLRTSVMKHADKMFPPGRIFHMAKRKNLHASSEEYDSDTEDETDLESVSLDEVVIDEVGPEFFRELVISPRMFDISRHFPSLYEDTLRSLMERDTSRAQQ